MAKHTGSGAESSKKRTAQLLEENRRLRVCLQHPKPLYFDGAKCPCCEVIAEQREQAVKEFLDLTDEK